MNRPSSEPAHRLDPIPSVMLRRFPYFERTVYITSRKSEHRSKMDNYFFFAASGRPRPHKICSATPLGVATPGLKNQELDSIHRICILHRLEKDLVRANSFFLFFLKIVFFFFDPIWLPDHVTDDIIFIKPYFLLVVDQLVKFCIYR